MQYQWLSGEPIPLSIGKAVCVGRNYAEHAKELNNSIPQSPIFFIKPSTAITTLSPGFSIPKNQGACHFELEIACLIGKPSGPDVLDRVIGVGLALDLTLRTLQDELKQKGHPWERAKAFDGACPVSGFVEIEKITDINKLALELVVNGVVRQRDCASQMIFPVASLLAQMNECFTLLPGDLVLTGTPSGVGALNAGDQLQAKLLLGDELLMQADAAVC